MAANATIAIAFSVNSKLVDTGKNVLSAGKNSFCMKTSAWSHAQGILSSTSLETRDESVEAILSYAETGSKKELIKPVCAKRVFETIASRVRLKRKEQLAPNVRQDSPCPLRALVSGRQTVFKD